MSFENVNCPQIISPMTTDLLERFFHSGALLFVKHNGASTHVVFHKALELCTCRPTPSAINIQTMTINRLTLIAVQPRSKTSNGNQVGERKLVIIKVGVIHWHI